MLPLSTILLSVFITASLIPIIVRLAEKYHMVDYPNPRKVHVRPVPRIGGVAMAAGAAVPIILWAVADDFVQAFLAGAGVLVAFGFVDDMKGLGYKAKFLGQFLAASIIVFLGGLSIDSLGGLWPAASPLPEWAAIPLTIIAVVGVTNAINLADGLDGLAGGISLLIFCAIGYLAYLQNDMTVVLLCLALVGAIFGFLRFNTHPATLFMGDTGSQLLGYSAIVLALHITQSGTPLSPFLPLIILGFPILDTMTVMVNRIREGRSPFSPDKNHFHHRLMRLGLFHSEAVFVIYVIQSALVISSVFLMYYNDWAILLAFLLFSVVVTGTLGYADRRGFQFKRSGFFDRVFKGRLRKIRDEYWGIRIAFGGAKTIIPAVLLLSCLLPERIPQYAAWLSALFMLALALVYGLAKFHLGFCLRVVVYLTVPSLLYLVEDARSALLTDRLFFLYHLTFGVIALLILTTVKLSRRTKGFYPTTMDYLVIFIAVVVPSLPNNGFQSQRLGLLAAQIIVTLFGCEVLITELRGKWNIFTACVIAGLTVIGVRGALGW